MRRGRGMGRERRVLWCSAVVAGILVLFSFGGVGCWVWIYAGHGGWIMCGSVESACCWSSL